MTYHITLQPGGKSFLAEAGETLLEAALRAGINLSYNCSNGSCGACEAKLLAGEVAQTRHHDYTCKPAADGIPRLLTCCTVAGSDMVIEAAESGSPRDVPHQEIETRVYKLERLADDIMVLQLRTPRSQTLQFLAGQYVTLEIDGLDPRSKSIASCPCNGMYLHFHVHASENDAFSSHVFERMKTKETVRVKGPGGQFTLDDESTRPILFIANDTGFAPIKSLIEHAISLELAQAMHLYWNMPTGKPHYMANYCRAWEDALDNFHFHPLNSSSGTLGELANTIIDHHADLSAFDAYLNGPADKATGLLDALLARGLQKDRLFIDRISRY